MAETSTKWSLAITGHKRRIYDLLLQIDPPAAEEWVSDAESVDPDDRENYDDVVGEIWIDDLARFARLLSILLPEGGCEGQKTAKFVDQVALSVDVASEGIRSTASLSCEYNKCQQYGGQHLLWDNNRVRLLAAAISARDRLAEAIKENKE